MMNTDSLPRTIQSTTSRFLLFIISVVLFGVFFTIEHDIFYTTRASDFNFSEAETSLISQGDAGKQISVLLLFLFCAYIMRKRKGHFLVIIDPIAWLIFTYSIWAMFSFFWADDPTLVGRRIVLFSILIFSAFSISMNVSLRQLPTIVMWITAPILTIGFFSERTLRTWWFGAEDYRFSGTCHPESQAINCAMLFLAAATMTRKGGHYSRVMFLGVMFVAVVFLLLTKSRGPFVGTIIAYGVHEICTKKRSILVTYLYAILVALGITALVLGDTLMPALSSGINLGREESVSGLSGRAEIWSELSGFVKERPVLGYGLGGFWTEARVLAFADSHRWRVRDSHSIYLDTVLDLGFIGLVIIVLLLIVAWLRTRQTCLNGGDEGGAFALSLLTLWMADGILSSLVLGRGFITLLLFIVLFGVARESQIRHARRVTKSDG